jgi:membrane fusion protein (multidrug efflux system)
MCDNADSCRRLTVLSSLRDEADVFNCSTRWTVELFDELGHRVGVVRSIGSDGVRVHLSVAELKGLCSGGVVEFSSNTSPIGSIRAQARVNSLELERDHRGRAYFSVSLTFIGASDPERHELKSRLSAIKPLIVVSGLDCQVSEQSLPGFRIREAKEVPDIFRYYEQDQVAVLVLGPRLSPSESRCILSRCVNEFPEILSINVVLNMGPTGELFQEFVDEDRVFYLAHASVSEPQLHSVLVSAADRFLAQIEHKNNEMLASTPKSLLDLALRLSQQNTFENASSLLSEEVRDALAANRAQFVMYDRETETLWSVDPRTKEELRESAATGVMGYVTRTREGVRSQRVGTDPRYDASVDDPGGRPDAHLLAEPVFDLSGSMLGVITASRDAQRAPFTAEDSRTLQLIASYAAPTFILLDALRRQRSSVETAEVAIGRTDIFRAEALEYHAGASAQEGDVLKGIPRWLSLSHLLVLLLAIGGVGYSVLARVHEISTGPAIIRARSKVSVTAMTGGLVRIVAVSVGDRVREGDLLVRLQSIPGDSLLSRIKEEVRATGDGVVSDIRVRAGQTVGSGDQIASIVDESAGNELIVFFPGSYAPQIHVGMTVALKIQGYPDSRELVPIDVVANEILGPHEAERYAGKESADAVAITGPVLITRSFIRRPVFEADGIGYHYHDGMLGEAKVSVRSDRMIINLVPGLKRIIAHPIELFRME